MGSAIGAWLLGHGLLCLIALLWAQIVPRRVRERGFKAGESVVHPV